MRKTNLELIECGAGLDRVEKCPYGPAGETLLAVARQIGSHYLIVCPGGDRGLQGYDAALRDDFYDPMMALRNQ